MLRQFFKVHFQCLKLQISHYPRNKVLRAEAKLFSINFYVDITFSSEINSIDWFF